MAVAARAAASAAYMGLGSLDRNENNDINTPREAATA